MYKIGDEFVDTGIGEKKHFKVLNIEKETVTLKSGKKKDGTILLHIENLLVKPEDWEPELRRVADKMKFFKTSAESITDLIEKNILQKKE